jgi:hypothetical protein
LIPREYRAEQIQSAFQCLEALLTDVYLTRLSGNVAVFLVEAFLVGFIEVAALPFLDPETGCMSQTPSSALFKASFVSTLAIEGAISTPTCSIPTSSSTARTLG